MGMKCCHEHDLVGTEACDFVHKANANANYVDRIKFKVDSQSLSLFHRNYIRRDRSK